METDKLTLGSLFDGSGGFPLGALLTKQIVPLWASEIEPFPIRVTTKRLPRMKHYGDISAQNGADLPPVDIITFGSPCQDMSVAGKRSGLDGERSSLFYQAVRIVKEMRCKTHGEKPRYIVWENVRGAFSSNKGKDFRAVLDSLCKIKKEDYVVPELPNGKWDNAGCIMGENFSLAWRLFDAQYWGVPQRRKRIYLVADFDGGSAGKILFESEGVSGYTPQGFRSWQGTAGGAEESVGTSSCGDNENNLPTLVGKSEKQVSYARNKRREALDFKLIEQHKSFISKTAQGYEKRLREEPEHERFERRKHKFEHFQKQLAAIDEILSLSREITSAEFWLNVQSSNAWFDLFDDDEYGEDLIARMRKQIKAEGAE